MVQSRIALCIAWHHCCACYMRLLLYGPQSSNVVCIAVTYKCSLLLQSVLPLGLYCGVARNAVMRWSGSATKKLSSAVRAASPPAPECCSPPLLLLLLVSSSTSLSAASLPAFITPSARQGCDDADDTRTSRHLLALPLDSTPQIPLTACT